ncbi:MAG: CAP domain-containing protein [Planctomycetes bacterium]|nr:CAP domain-containing protein [Planctomycetota bacterium]
MTFNVAGVRAGVALLVLCLGLNACVTVHAEAKSSLNEQISTIKSKWTSERPADVKKVDDAFSGLKQAVAASEEDRAKVVKALKDVKEQAAAKAVAEAIAKAGVTRGKLRAILVKGRPAALEAIFDPKYTESDNNKLQPKVDEACQPLIAIWNDPVGYAAKNMKLDIATPAAKLDAFAARLGELDESLGKWEAGKAEDYMRKAGAPSFNIKREELEENDSLMRQNDSMKDKQITDATRAVVRAVNDYRMMLGKKALIVELKLSQAAQGHTKYLESVKKVGHIYEDHPDGKTPKDRCGKAGYGNANVGENCGRAPDAQAVVWVWYKAAEHHRGMVMGWEYVGAGNTNEYWVLNFGGGDADRSGDIQRK